jgi:excisionase family DNA binding protein
MIAPNPVPLVRTMREATQILRIGMSSLKVAISKGEIKTVRYGRSVRIPEAELVRFVESKLAASA